jgi:hypothetical protein
MWLYRKALELLTQQRIAPSGRNARARIENRFSQTMSRTATAIIREAHARNLAAYKQNRRKMTRRSCERSCASR